MDKVQYQGSLVFGHPVVAHLLPCIVFSIPVFLANNVNVCFVQPSAPGSYRKLNKDAVPTVFDLPQHLQVYSVFSQLHLIAPMA